MTSKVYRFVAITVSSCRRVRRRSRSALNSSICARSRSSDSPALPTGSGFYSRRGSAGAGQRGVVLLDLEAVIVERVFLLVQAQIRIRIALFFIVLVVDGALL